MLPVRFVSVFNMPPTDPPESSATPLRLPRRRKREVPQLDLWSADAEPVAVTRKQVGAEVTPHGAVVAGALASQANNPTGTANQQLASARPPPLRGRAQLPISAEGSIALTRRQEHLLEHLRSRAAAGAQPPTLAELCSELGLVSRGSLHKQVSALIEAGLVEPMLGKQRGVRLRRPAEIKESRLPLLGRIGGEGRLHALGRYESITVPAWLGPDAEGFVLTVEGDRWAHFGISEGDLLVIAARAQPAESDLVAILIDDQEYLLGRLRHDIDVLVIESDAPPAPTRRVMATRAHVQGVVRGLIRRLHHG